MKEIVPAQQGKTSVLKKSAMIVGAASAAVLAAVTSSFAAVADLFTAVDTTGLDTSTTTIMLFMVTIGLMFFGRNILRRIGVSI